MNDAIDKKNLNVRVASKEEVSSALQVLRKNSKFRATLDYLKDK